MIKQKKTPLRMCICCKAMKSKKDMMRIVKVGENEFVLDETGKMNGRGAYICKEGDCIQKSVDKRLLNRSYKQNVNGQIYEIIKEHNETK